MYPSGNLLMQVKTNASKAIEKAKREMIPVLEISMDRINAIYEMAQRSCKGHHMYDVPNGNFSDAEVELWSLFNRAFWFDPEGK